MKVNPEANRSSRRQAVLPEIGAGSRGGGEGLEFLGGLGEVGFEAEGLLVFVAGVGVVGVQLQCFLKLGVGVLEAAGVQEGDAEAVVGRGKIGFDADGFLKMADGFGDALLLKQGGAEVEVGVGAGQTRRDVGRRGPPEI
jgi:hypothetical protein